MYSPVLANNGYYRHLRFFVISNNGRKGLKNFEILYLTFWAKKTNPISSSTSKKMFLNSNLWWKTQSTFFQWKLFFIKWTKFWTRISRENLWFLTKMNCVIFHLFVQNKWKKLILKPSLPFLCSTLSFVITSL